jgi:hypothetical protein
VAAGALATLVEGTGAAAAAGMMGERVTVEVVCAKSGVRDDVLMTVEVRVVCAAVRMGDVLMTVEVVAVIGGAFCKMWK